MARKFDRIMLAVPELSAASAQYHQLFGLPPFTNNIVITNLGLPVVLSGFETATGGVYSAATNFEGWQMDANQVETRMKPWSKCGCSATTISFSSSTPSRTRSRCCTAAGAAPTD